MSSKRPSIIRFEIYKRNFIILPLACAATTALSIMFLPPDHAMLSSFIFGFINGVSFPLVRTKVVPRHEYERAVAEQKKEEIKKRWNSRFEPEDGDK